MLTPDLRWVGGHDFLHIYLLKKYLRPVPDGPMSENHTGPLLLDQHWPNVNYLTLGQCQVNQGFQ